MIYRFILSLFLFVTICAQERITNFDSTVTVQQDGVLSVVERITVFANAREIKRGIIREFPTIYTDFWGRRYVVSFDIKEVLLDGHSVAYKVKKISNGVRIFIGQSDVYLQPGLYTFTIAYHTNRQIGFFQDHDELYWNVTGNGWRLPIDHVIAKIQLPEAIDVNTVSYTAYTGAFGERAMDYRVFTGQHTIVFESTAPFDRYEGLTVAIGFPKGFVHQPTWWETSWYFIRDNGQLIWLFLGFILLLFFYSYHYICIKKQIKPGTIIPLFYPPKGFSPGMVRVLSELQTEVDAKTFAAEIVNLAVAGQITLEYKKGGLFKKHDYVLHKKDTQRKLPFEWYNAFMQKLFGSHKTIQLSYGSTQTRKIINEGNAFLQQQIVNPIKNNYFDFHSSIRTIGAIGFVIWSLFGIGSDPEIVSHAWFFIFLVLSIFSIVLFSLLFKRYTQPGQRIKDEIDGFKLFLSVTETERLKIIGTSPTKTPELYETYLPYAIALGVEQAWSAQFAPLFAQMQEQGIVYSPLWYSGPMFSPDTFASNLTRDLETNLVLPSTVSSSSDRPGSSSGMGGSGSSGGGGGGGGGGGW